jgi:hypothetical protein
MILETSVDGVVGENSFARSNSYMRINSHLRKYDNPLKYRFLLANRGKQDGGFKRINVARKKMGNPSSPFFQLLFPQVILEQRIFSGLRIYYPEINKSTNKLFNF